MHKKSSKLLNVAMAVVFAASVATFAASSPIQARSRAASLPTFRWYGLYATAWPSSLDPAEITDSFSYNIADQIQSNLVTIEPNGGIAPTPGHPASCWEKVHGRCQVDDTSLAQSVTESRNRLSYTFTLRKGLKFADGHKITPADIEYSLWRALSHRVGSPVALLYLGHIKGAAADAAGHAKTLSGVRTLNSRTLRITLDKPIAYFLKTLSYPTGDVLDPALVRGKQAGAVTDYLNDTCIDVGAGQFVFQCRNHKHDPTHSGFYPPGRNASITLVPNKNFWGPKPHIKLFMQAYLDVQHSYFAYEANEIDITQVPAIDIAKYRHSKQFLMYPEAAVDYMTANEHPKSPFHNVHCRLAIAYGLDRNYINNVIWHGSQQTTYQILPRNIPPFSKQFENTKFDKKNGVPYYNKKEAAAQLRKCPQLKGYHLVIPYQNTSTDLTNEYTVVAAEIKSIIPHYLGSVTIKGLTFNDWLGVVATSAGLDKTGIGKVDIAENLWIEDYPDAQDFLTNLLHTGANYNIGYFSNKTYDKLTDKADVTANQGTRNKLYTQAEEIALREGAWISIGNLLLPTLVKPYVHGLVGSAAYGFMVPTNNLWAKVRV